MRQLISGIILVMLVVSCQKEEDDPIIIPAPVVNIDDFPPFESDAPVFTSFYPNEGYVKSGGYYEVLGFNLDSLQVRIDGNPLIDSTDFNHSGEYLSFRIPESVSGSSFVLSMVRNNYEFQRFVSLSTEALPDLGYKIASTPIETGEDEVLGYSPAAWQNASSEPGDFVDSNDPFETFRFCNDFVFGNEDNLPFLSSQNFVMHWDNNNQFWDIESEFSVYRSENTIELIFPQDVLEGGRLIQNGGPTQWHFRSSLTGHPVVLEFYDQNPFQPDC